MKIMKISQMGGSRKVKAILVGGPNGEKKLILLPNQQLGNSCHAIQDATLKGPAIGKGSWNDDPTPPDYRVQQQTIGG